MRYLSREEKGLTKKLYREAFPEDSDQFMDYYYAEKASSDDDNSNEILVCEDGKEIVAMSHLNPYLVRLRDREYWLKYIVAVATKETHRRQGLMRSMIIQFFQDMYREGEEPFTFLLPANPAYYEPFDFTFVNNYIETQMLEDVQYKIVEFTQDREMALLAFWNQFLERYNDVFCVRDSQYLERLQKELATENGKIELVLDEQERVHGAKISWGIKKSEVREFICDHEFARMLDTKKPYMMARIIRLDLFIESICLREDSLKVGDTYKLRIIDSLIPQNDGTYLWHINRESSYLEKLENEDTLNVPEFTIAELTSWLFGYTESHKADFCSQIQTLKGIFIDEVV